jgi:hypothetical protein
MLVGWNEIFCYIMRYITTTIWKMLQHHKRPHPNYREEIMRRN